MDDFVEQVLRSTDIFFTKHGFKGFKPLNSVIDGIGTYKVYRNDKGDCIWLEHRDGQFIFNSKINGKHGSEVTLRDWDDNVYDYTYKLVHRALYGEQKEDENMKVIPIHRKSMKLKSWSHFFQAIKAGKKTHDLRYKGDREFFVGQLLTLQEYDFVHGRYTGDEVDVEVTYITDDNVPCAFSSAVLPKDFCILSLKVVK